MRRNSFATSAGLWAYVLARSIHVQSTVETSSGDRSLIFELTKIFVQPNFFISKDVMDKAMTTLWIPVSHWIKHRSISKYLSADCLPRNDGDTGESAYSLKDSEVSEVCAFATTYHGSSHTSFWHDCKRCRIAGRIHTCSAREGRGRGRSRPTCTL